MRKEVIILSLFIGSFSAIEAQTDLHADNFMLTISRTGQIIHMTDPVNNKEYLATGERAPLLKIRTVTGWEEPEKADYNSIQKVISLYYNESKITAEVKVSENKGHLAFHLVSIDRKDIVNAVCWGPYPVCIGATIGEVVGVVRDGDYAIGLQALNKKTIGGILVSDGGNDDSRGSAAIARAYGSSIQAYSLDRSHPRIVSAWQYKYPDMPVAAIPGETTQGSAIALFGCPEDQVMERIGDIELTWGLPHPVINGIWHKQSPETGRAYLISDFNEHNIDKMLEYTEKAGLFSLYHEGPFKSWGHYIIDSIRFPHGNDGLRKCVEKASLKGIRIGVHTLSTFITTNDRYVTPVPDHRLAVTGSSVLEEDIDDKIREIRVQSNKYFLDPGHSTLHAVRIGDEIIRFKEVSGEYPYKLLDCERGAFGTLPSLHKRGEQACMLLDYPYNTLFPDFNLQQEIAGNLARFFNETGVSQMDFDGHEGCMSTGEGEYAVQAFAEKVFRETAHTLVNGTSRSSHYYWHICHYWNWGEPWYGGFSESQGDYRLDNQPFLERNYMPNMLGWFLLSATTTQADIEWMLARAAGYKAGFALVAHYNSLKNNPETETILELVRLWQQASDSGIFNAEQLSRLKDPVNEFHLEKDNVSWKLYPYRKHWFEHNSGIMEPGQPACSEWEIDNSDPEQPLGFTLTLTGVKGSVTDPWIELDGYPKLIMPGKLEAGYSVVCDGRSVRLYDSKGRYAGDIIPEKSIPVLTAGKHKIRFDCTSSEGDNIVTRILIRTICNPEIINIQDLSDLVR